MPGPPVNIVPGAIETIQVFYGSDWELDYQLAVDVSGAEILASIVDPAGVVVCAFDIDVTTSTNPCVFTKTLSSDVQKGAPGFYPSGTYRHDMRIKFSDGTIRNITPRSPLIVSPTETPVP